MPNTTTHNNNRQRCKWMLCGVLLGTSLTLNASLLILFQSDVSSKISPRVDVPSGERINALNGNIRLRKDANIIHTDKSENTNFLNSSIKRHGTTKISSMPTKILPDKVISIFGTESSGSTFVATTLGIASGIFPANGTYVTLPPDEEGNPGRVIVEHAIHKRAKGRQEWRTDGFLEEKETLEIQHLSLPWGMWYNKRGNCDPRNAKNTAVVEALVPEECFRFDYEVDWSSRLSMPAPVGCVEEVRISEANVGKNNYNVKKSSASDVGGGGGDADGDESAQWTCGATCGTGPHNGFALYPRRFFVNISSHINWYLQRNVDITVVVIIRDRWISSAGKMKVHCDNGKNGENYLRNKFVTDGEEAKAMGIMREALSKYGRKRKIEGSALASSENSENETEERVIAVSYEALMSLKESYLFDVYHRLGIDSLYVPEFKDGNQKYQGQKMTYKVNICCN